MTEIIVKPIIKPNLKQQEAIDKAKLKENKDHGQTENQGR